MIPLRALTAACCALAFAGPATAASSPAVRVTVVGDSLAEGTAPYIPALLPGWQVVQSFDVGRHAPEGVDVVRSQAWTLGRYVVVSLGTNDDPRNVSSFRLSVEQVLALAGPGRCVVWANIVRPPAAGTSYDGYNAVLLQAAQRIRNFRLVDWATMVRFHPELLAADGVHTTAAGYRARAAAIVAAIRSCR
jgi:hypothetical protein